MRERILVVDDEESIVDLLKYHLEKEGYTVDTATNGVDALENAYKNNPDLIILDIMLPEMDGFDVCQKIRKDKSTPILMLTAKTDEVDKIVGLEIGADDYVTKPFSYREILARVKAILRRNNMNVNKGSKKSSEITYDDITLNTNTYQVTKKGDKIPLTRKEFDLLRLLMENCGNVLSRDMLLERIWGYDYDGGTRTVDVHVRRLRQKIEEDPDQPKYVETVHGIGYKFREFNGNGKKH